MWSVYRHISPSGKVYIGITSICPEDRWSKGYGKQTIFGKAIKKYGFDAFTHEILFSGLTKEDAENMEIELIREYKGLGISYNDANGGFCRGKQSDETKEKIRRKKLGIHINIGHEVTEETRAKLRIAMTGRSLSEATKNKIRNHPNIKGNRNRRKTVYQLDDNLTIIAKYNTTCEAAEATGTNRCNISACCKGRLKHTGGYKWSYEYESNNL